MKTSARKTGVGRENASYARAGAVSSGSLPRLAAAPRPLLAWGEALDGKIPTGHRSGGGRAGALTPLAQAEQRPAKHRAAGRARGEAAQRSACPRERLVGAAQGSAQPGQRCEAAPRGLLFLPTRRRSSAAALAALPAGNWLRTPARLCPHSRGGKCPSGPAKEIVKINK